MSSGETRAIVNMVGPAIPVGSYTAEMKPEPARLGSRARRSGRTIVQTRKVWFRCRM